MNRSLKISKVALTSLAQKGECWIWIMRGLGFIPTGGNIFHWILFHVWILLASDANIGIIASVVCL